MNEKAPDMGVDMPPLSDEQVAQILALRPRRKRFARRERKCSVCHWRGPRSRLWRWGDGFVCLDERACRFRYEPRTREELEREIADLERRLSQADD